MPYKHLEELCTKEVREMLSPNYLNELVELMTLIDTPTKRVWPRYKLREELYDKGVGATCGLIDEVRPGKTKHRDYFAIAKAFLRLRKKLTALKKKDLVKFAFALGEYSWNLGYKDGKERGFSEGHRGAYEDKGSRFKHP